MPDDLLKHDLSGALGMYLEVASSRTGSLRASVWSVMLAALNLSHTVCAVAQPSERNVFDAVMYPALRTCGGVRDTRC